MLPPGAEGLHCLITQKYGKDANTNLTLCGYIEG